jgi:isoleucyl-tRNA synthetase
MHGFIQDAQGRKMSKSLGNYILPEEVISKYGVDTMRYYMLGGAKPAVDLNYNFDDMKIKHKNLGVLWNLHKFLIDYAHTIGKNPAKLKMDMKHAGNEEKYMLSRLNSTIEKVTHQFEEYLLNEIPGELENLYLDLSRKYIQAVRDKSVTGTDEEKKAILYTIYTTLTELLKMFTPIVPFISEEIYLNFKKEFGLKEESISLFSWPRPEVKLIDKDLETRMDTASSVIQAVLCAREKAQLGIRWPVKEIIIVTKDKDIKKSVEIVEDMIKTQTNVKAVKIVKEFKEIKTKVRADFKKLGPKFGEQTPTVIAKLAQEPASKILSHLEGKNKFELKADKKKFEIVREDLIIERDVPGYLAEAELKGAVVYLNKERTDELEAEGFSREITRRVQSLRKDAELSKVDRIVLCIKVDEEMELALKPWVDSVKEKVGAKQIKISKEGPAKKYKNAGEAKIKGKEIKIYFDKV